MVQNDKYGTSWAPEELDAIVAPYFAMLAKELAREPYIKARYAATVMAELGRSHRSVEFKNQNISAVLQILGLPWISGYRPKANYQNAIFDAIDRHLSRDRSLLEIRASVPAAAPLTSSVFVDAPAVEISPDPLPARLQRLVRKFDPVERDYRNRNLGKAGEGFVFDLEQRQLREADRADLAQKVRWVAQEDGDGAGYDIHSYAVSGSERLIEVKTTNGAATTPFFLTRNEREVATERQANWRIYRVHLFATNPRIFTISAPLEEAVHLRPETWRAFF